MNIHYKYIVIIMEYKILHYKSIQELSTLIVSSPSIEISASPTTLQDNSCRAKKSDKDRPTKEVVPDCVMLTTLTWSSTRAYLYK